MVHSCDQFRANAEKAAGLGRCAGRLGALNAGRLGNMERKPLMDSMIALRKLNFDLATR